MQVHDLFHLAVGARVSRRDLYELIRLSKQPGSHSWSGAQWKIGNTPQQGINWIGSPSEPLGLIVKSRPGSYDADGWNNTEGREYRYSFKARKGQINPSETANKVLAQQPAHGAPVLLFTQAGSQWVFEGRFGVTQIDDASVILSPEHSIRTDFVSAEHDGYPEGDRQYVIHRMAERNRAVVNNVKSQRSWICDICVQSFRQSYGIDYIEAHHKTPLSQFIAEHIVVEDDFALLCPNCHKAVHLYMRKDGMEYEEIKRLLARRD